jgi:hypothetical protein
VATQPELGVLPERRSGLAFGDSGCPAFAGQNLKGMGRCSVGGKARESNSNAGKTIFPGGGQRNLQKIKVYVAKH